MSKRRSDIASAIQHLKMAQMHLESWMMDHPGTKGVQLFRQFVKKIVWMFDQIITNPFLPAPVRAGAQHEIESDVFAVPAITEKIALLNPEQREILEDVIEKAIRGEIEFVN